MAFMQKVIKFFTLFIILLILLLISSDAMAFRCGNKVISYGDRQITVLKYCGKPDNKITTQKEVFRKRFTPYGVRGFLVTINVEQWTYNLGPQRLIRILTFENGKLVDVDTDDYGFQK